ncbi:MAG TPA: aminotransferase class V-fold PLP-dependent enzyme [Dyadobacter sp.]|jgi:cysteine desulfurase/selenocysteine lyase|nr:aminotransferase class V-fold PLP-dependent enzyme [Dyadobacter sp.]
MIDITAIRKDTPGCHDKVFFNSASSSLMTQTATDKMIAYLSEEQMSGGYKAAQAHAAAVEDFYHQAAKLLNCKTSNIAFAYNATDAYGKALSSIPFRDGDTIITTAEDYISNQLAFLSLRKRFGLQIIRAKTMADNSLDIEDFEALVLKHNPALVAVTHVPTNSGLIQDVEAVGALCSKYDVLYLVDACQSIGQLLVDVQKIQCDFITATGRKFLRGPRGTGILYVSDKALERNLQPMIIDSTGAGWMDANQFSLDKTARRFELWERSYMSVIGFAETLRYINTIGMDQIADYNLTLSAHLRSLLAENDKIQVLDRGIKLSNIITLQAADKTIDQQEAHLQQSNIYYSVSKLNTVPVNTPSGNADYAIRLSPHYFNTKEEIEQVAGLLRFA